MGGRCLLADQSIGKYRHRGESRRDMQDEREREREREERADKGKGTQERWRIRGNTKRERDSVKKDIGDNGRRPTGCIRDGITWEKTSLEGWPPLSLFESSRSEAPCVSGETKNVALPLAAWINTPRAFFCLVRADHTYSLLVIRGLLIAFCLTSRTSKLWY